MRARPWVPLTLEEAVRGFGDEASLLDFRVENHEVVAKPKHRLGYSTSTVLEEARRMGGDYSVANLPGPVTMLRIPLRTDASLIEDLNGGGLSDYESAKLLKHLLDSFGDKYLTRRELASSLGKSPVWVSQHLKMLKLQGLVNELELSKMTRDHAGRILSLPREERREVLEGIAKTCRIPSLAELESLPSTRALEPGPKAYAFLDYRCQ